MRLPQNIKSLASITPDFIGFIFYKKSPRYVMENNNQTTIAAIDSEIKKVGVFVNESIDNLVSKVRQFNIDIAQLHGGESVEYCRAVKESDIKVIKVFSVKDELPIDQIHEFEDVVDYFLFDTKTVNYGGSGAHFDWSILEDYNSEKPFFLSGGIESKDLPEILKLDLPQLHALDINSKFETAPGVKDIELIKEFDKALQINENIREV